MDRREFISSTVIGLTCGCSCLPTAAASPRFHECRMLGAGDAMFRSKLRTTSGTPDVDRACQETAAALFEKFPVRPGWCFYDDTDRVNALATPEALLPNGPDGTVMLGITLLNRRINVVKSAPGSEPSIDRARLSVAAVMAHEFAHIIQFKRGMPPDGPWQMEPHADFMAGWFVGQSKDLGIGLAAGTMDELGDYFFKSSDHHGEPGFRSTMVLAGYGAAKLDVEAAYEAGRRKAFASLSEILQSILEPAREKN